MTRDVKESCTRCGGTGLIRRRCCDPKLDLESIDSPHNYSSIGYGDQHGYQVYRCKICGDEWGCDYDYSAAGSDVKYKRRERSVKAEEPPPRDSERDEAMKSNGGSI